MAKSFTIAFIFLLVNAKTAASSSPYIPSVYDTDKFYAVTIMRTSCYFPYKDAKLRQDFTSKIAEQTKTAEDKFKIVAFARGNIETCECYVIIDNTLHMRNYGAQTFSEITWTCTEQLTKIRDFFDNNENDSVDEMFNTILANTWNRKGFLHYELFKYKKFSPKQFIVNLAGPNSEIIFNNRPVQKNNCTDNNIDQILLEWLRKVKINTESKTIEYTYDKDDTDDQTAKYQFIFGHEPNIKEETTSSNNQQSNESRYGLFNNPKILWTVIGLQSLIIIYLAISKYYL